MATTEMFQLCPGCGMLVGGVCEMCSIRGAGLTQAVWPPMPVNFPHPEPVLEELDLYVPGRSVLPLAAMPPKPKQQRKAPTPIGQKSEAEVRRQAQKNASQEGHRAMNKQITALCKENRAHGMCRDTKVSSKAFVCKWAEEYGLAWDGVGDHFELAPTSEAVHATQVASLRGQGVVVWENPYYSGRNKIPALGKFPEFWKISRV